LAFSHCDPVKGEDPCKTGFDIWVMRADGTEPARVVSAEAEDLPDISWSVNGDRIVYGYGWEGPTVSCDLDGTDRQELRVRAGNVSPDGSKVVCDWTTPDVVDGEPGVWCQLCLSNADGSGERTLVQHFVKDSDAIEHLRGIYDNPESMLEDLRVWVGPKDARWSPRGDRVVFTAVLPSFDPQGAPYKFQLEPWIYELATGILTRLIPHDPSEAARIVDWRGPNTYREEPRVTVGNTTLIFSEVTSEGVTTVIRDDDRPAKPGGYRFGGYYYDIRTTAQYRGPVRIGMKYEDKDVGGGGERELAIQRYVEAKGEWEDITRSRDLQNNIVYAVVDSL